MQPLPFKVHEAFIQACGKAFWLRGTLRTFFLSAGVPAHVYDAHKDQTSKYVIARNVLNDLSRMDAEGMLTQRRLITELSQYTKAVDETVTDKAAAQLALNELREAVAEYDNTVVDKRQAISERKRRQALRDEGVETRRSTMTELQGRFNALVADTQTPQRRGFALEALFVDLLNLEEIPARKSIRTPTQQIDGYFEFEGFRYLLECKWEKEPPNESDFAAFTKKISTKIGSTRGLFLSYLPARPEVVNQIGRGEAWHIALMDGQDLALVLQGIMSTTDALKYKIDRASSHGEPFAPLAGARA